VTKTKSRPQSRKAGPVQELADYIAGCELPGDEPLSDGRRREIAEFLLDAAAVRPAESVTITIASAPEGRRGTRIALINDDMPFLVDSIASTLAEFGLVADTLVHPVVPVQRDAEGNFKALKQGVAPVGEESFIYVEAPRVDGAHRHQIEEALQATLADVRAAVEDWPKLVAAMERDARSVTDPEGRALLDWFSGAC